MNVKDIRLVREFYKTNIKRTSDTDRNPHFAGEEKEINGAIQFGFFEMFNGQGEIENKLTTILNIAGDSQAIYEFMQNAVDADSKNFFLAKHGPDQSPYLIVLNDGEYFTLESIISILAIGASSKYRNPDNIGQFGVGFKLAHRLIGADNSLKELLEENKGPLLFSWSNGELADLASDDKFELVDPECTGFGKKAVSRNSSPWLFKIVATNFPCTSNDPVWDAKGRYTNNLLTDEDQLILKSAAKQCLEQVRDSVNFRNGTLLVIPLHPAKVEHVIGKVPKGLEVAATIISRRANKPHDLRTQIETEELHPELLNAEQWQLNEEETRGQLGSEQVKVAELMFLYGDPFKGNPFKGKPQFYRYFPMSLEQHGFRFAIHANALTLSSARTELQENNSNKFLFSRLIPLLEKKLLDYSDTKPVKFSELYCSILLSNRGEGTESNWIQGRQWLEEALWQPLMEMLGRNIPVKDGESFTITNEPEKVLIKSSKLPIEEWTKPGSERWFNWGEKELPLVCFEAKQKLRIKEVNLLDILSETSSIARINSWLILEPNNALKFLEELNGAAFEGYEKLYDKILLWKNVMFLNLWWFDNTAYSIDSLAKDPNLKFFLVNFGPLNDIKDRLSQTGILISTHHLTTYSRIELPVREAAQKLLLYFYNYEELNKLLSIRFAVSTELSAKDKQVIFERIEVAVKNSAGVTRRIDTMNKLALFSNKRQEVKALFQLTSLSDLPIMLQGWRINEGETVGINLKEYLSDTKEALYENLIKPFWNDISKQEIEEIRLERKPLFSFVKQCYKQRPGLGGLVPEQVFFAQVDEKGKNFYHPSLAGIREKDYPIVANVLSQIGFSIPQQELLQYYSDAPFLLPTTLFTSFTDFPASISLDEAKAFVTWLAWSFPEIAKSLIFTIDAANKIRINAKSEIIHHYFSTEKDINKYIQSFHSASLLLLPEILMTEVGDNSLQGEKLLFRLIHEVYEDAVSQLVRIIRKHGNDQHKKKLLNNITPIELTAEIPIESLESEVLKLCFSISNSVIQREALDTLICVKNGESRIPLGKLQNRGADSLIVEHPKEGKIQFSINALLSGKGNALNQQLEKVAKHWNGLQIGSLDQIQSAFGITKERSMREVWEALLGSLEGGKITNGEQILFIWATGKSNEINKLEPKVETLAGWVALKGAFYLTALDFIPTEKVLNSNYLLSTTFTNPPIISAGNWSVQSIPFLNGTGLLMPEVQEIKKNDHAAFWKHLFDEWHVNGKPEKIQLPEEVKSWESLLGLIPATYITLNDYADTEERVPYSLISSFSLPEDSINNFILALGAQGDNSAVVKTRKYFKGTGGSIDTGMSSYQTAATLKWLHTTNLSLVWEDIAGFYRNLAGKNEGLLYFPAYTPGFEKLKMVSILSEAFYLTKEELQKAGHHELKFTDLAKAADAPIINLVMLQD